MMDFKERAHISARAICEILKVNVDDDTRQRVAEIVEGSMLDAVLENGERYTQLIMRHCAADRDLAHKITEDIRRTQSALVTNLSSMR